MKKVQFFIILAVLVKSSGHSLLDIELIKNYFSQLKNLYFNISEVTAKPNGLLDISDIKNKILQWKTQKLAALCPPNAGQLQNLLNIVCSTAQSTNVTARDSCITCFSRVTSLPEGPQELTALSVCAAQYFTNTSYAACATNLAALSTSALNVQTAGCYMGYCDFVRCLRRVNSVNLITQCTREARTGVNITVDADNVRFFNNVTSCVLAKSRCGTFNPITGDPQTPGAGTTGIRVSNALQITAAGDLRVIAFSANTPVAASFCTTTTNLTQTSWLTNVC